MSARRRVGTLAAVVPAVLLAACSVSVRGDEPGESADVDIQTPLGDLSVRTERADRDTGLAVHPGARPLRDGRRRPTSANVNIDSPLLDLRLRVAAAEFEDDTSPDRIVEFYKQQMGVYGDVLECRGDLDFRGRPGSQRPVCREDPQSREVNLVVGTESHHRIVVVKPRRNGSEFAMVYVRTDR